MPLVTITVRKPKSIDFKSKVFDAVHAALVGSGVPVTDKFQRKVLEDMMRELSKTGLNPENVMVCFKETSWENWSFGGGRLIHT